MAGTSSRQLTAGQLREVNTAIRHIGRALRALNRANLPVAGSSGTEGWLFELNRGERKLGEASDQIIDGLILLDPTSDDFESDTAHVDSDH